MVSGFWICGGMGEPIGFDLDKAASHLQRLGLYDQETLVKLQAISEAAMEGLEQRRKMEEAAREARGSAHA